MKLPCTVPRNPLTDLQQILNEDLASVAEWLNDHKRTLNVAKCKFMIIGSSQIPEVCREI